MQDNKNFLGTEPVGKLLLKLSIPTVIAQLINMLYNIVDRIYIGHIPGGGKSGTYRCGRLYADHYDRFRFCSTGQFRWCTESFYLYGKTGYMTLLRRS